MKTPVSIAIYQIYYQEKQKIYLDPAFIPYDNTKNPQPKWCEMYLMNNFYTSQEHLKSDYSGLVSWKFGQKTALSGQKFLEYIQDNPGYDVYFINPFPHESYFFKNVWLQGDECHPGVLDFVQTLFNKSGYHIDLRKLHNNNHNTLFCNYWVGNQTFWQGFMDFITPIYNYMQYSLTTEEKEFINRPADRVISANYIPFILERMFSTYLALPSTSGSIKCLAYPWNEREVIRRSGLPRFYISSSFFKWLHDQGRHLNYFSKITLKCYLLNGQLKVLARKNIVNKFLMFFCWNLEGVFWFLFQVMVLLYRGIYR